MTRRTITLLAALTCASLFSIVASAECLAYAVAVEAVSDGYDQQQLLARRSLELGAENVQTAVAKRATGVGPRYLVISRGCEVEGSFQVTEDHLSKIVAPDESPYLWQVTWSMAEAGGVYGDHATAAARGVESLGDGTFLVYWSRAVRP